MSMRGAVRLFLDDYELSWLPVVLKNLIDPTAIAILKECFA